MNEHQQSESQEQRPADEQSTAPVAESGSPPDTPEDDVAALQARVAQLEAERQANLEHWQRSQADFDNYRKRQQREFEQERLYRSLPVARELLPVLDNLRRALQAASANPDFNQLLQGVELVARQFEDGLDRVAVKPIEDLGHPFDPNLHEAIQQIPTADHPPMTVIQVVEQGYMLHDRVVRPSKVIVSAPPPEQAGGSN